MNEAVSPAPLATLCCRKCGRLLGEVSADKQSIRVGLVSIVAMPGGHAQLKCICGWRTSWRPAPVADNIGA